MTGPGKIVFARYFVRANRRDPTGVFRQRLLAGLGGHVAEVGAGHGLNFAHYPAGVTNLVALEPNRHLRRLAHAEAARSDIEITVREGYAERLPLDDDSVDAVVLSSVLCRVHSQPDALAEVARVLRRGGQLRFWEHVLAEERWLSTCQRAVRPGWRVLSGGCDLARDTERAIVTAGFSIDRCERFRLQLPLALKVTSPRILGSAHLS